MKEPYTNKLLIKVRHGMRAGVLFVKPFCPWLSTEERLRFAGFGDGNGYRSGQPNRSQIEYLIQTYNIRSVIVVRRDLKTYEVEVAKNYGITLFHIKFDGHVPPTKDMVDKFWAAVRDSNNRPFLLHCWYGKDRTGLFSFLYRVEEQGWSPKDAWEEMLYFGHAPFFIRSPYKKWLESLYGAFGLGREK